MDSSREPIVNICSISTESHISQVCMLSIVWWSEVCWMGDTVSYLLNLSLTRWIIFSCLLISGDYTLAGSVQHLSCPFALSAPDLHSQGTRLGVATDSREHASHRVTSWRQDYFSCYHVSVSMVTLVYLTFFSPSIYHLSSCLSEPRVALCLWSCRVRLQCWSCWSWSSFLLHSDILCCTDTCHSHLLHC